MPCTDGGVPYPDYTQQRLDKATRLLCELCDQLENGNFTGFSGEMSEWWRKHQKADAKRKAAEALEQQRIKMRERALNKLTPKERRLLGVRG